MGVKQRERASKTNLTEPWTETTESFSRKSLAPPPHTESKSSRAAWEQIRKELRKEDNGEISAESSHQEGKTSGAIWSCDTHTSSRSLTLSLDRVTKEKKKNNCSYLNTSPNSTSSHKKTVLMLFFDIVSCVFGFFAL